RSSWKGGKSMVVTGTMSGATLAPRPEAAQESRRPSSPEDEYGPRSEIYGSLYGFFGEQRGIEPGMDDGRSRQPSIAASEAPLPPERAFVVQLRSLTDPAGELFVGRVEHIASGTVLRFGSAAELTGFIARIGHPSGCARVDGGNPPGRTSDDS